MRSRLVALGLCILGGASVWFTGSVSGGARAAGAVALAAVGALIATRGWLRRVIAGVAVVLGLVMLTGGSAVAIAAGLLVVAGALIAVVTSPGWPVMGARYERQSTSDDTDLWSAIDRGEDPTASEDQTAGHDPTAGRDAIAAQDETAGRDGAAGHDPKTGRDGMAAGWDGVAGQDSGAAQR